MKRDTLLYFISNLHNWPCTLPFSGCHNLKWSREITCWPCMRSVSHQFHKVTWKSGQRLLFLTRWYLRSILLLCSSSSKSFSADSFLLPTARKYLSPSLTLSLDINFPAIEVINLTLPSLLQRPPSSLTLSGKTIYITGIQRPHTLQRPQVISILHSTSISNFNNIGRIGFYPWKDKDMK